MLYKSLVRGMFGKKVEGNVHPAGGREAALASIYSLL